jgi:hypothetical protein
MAEMIAASVDELHYHHIGIYEPGLSPKAEAVSAIYR